MSNVVLNILSEFKGKKAFSQADKAIAKLQKQTVILGKSLGLALGTSAMTLYGKKAVKAFADDQKAVVLLTNAVNNLGLSFENTRLTEFISSMEKSTGIVDDELRPAMQSLLTTTGSLSKSQGMLALAIDVSRGSGVDLSTVVDDLTKAYTGQTRGLEKYKLGLTRAELKASTFLEIQKALDKQFSGSSQVYLQTYAGQLDILTVAMETAKESIGKGLFDAIANANGGTTSADAVKGIENVANAINTVTSAVGKAIGAVTLLYRGIDKFTTEAGKSLFTVATFGRYYYETYAGTSANNPQTLDIQQRQHDAYKNAAARKAAEAEANKRNKQLADLLKKQTAAQKALTAEQKKQAALKKAAALFDMEQIQIIAALKGNISADERKRLELQLAIATGNVDEAKKLTYELAISQGMTVKLAQSLASMPMANNPFAGWKGYLDEIELQAKRIASITGGGTGGGGAAVIPKTNVTPSDSFTQYGPLGGLGAGVIAGVNPQSAPIVVQIDGKTIATAVQDQSLNGIQAKVNRAMGGFDW